MPFDFPAAPTDGQVVTFTEGPSYVYNALSTAWDRSASATTPPPVPRPTVSDVIPNAAPIGGPPLTMRVIGTNFTVDSQVLLSVVPVPTTFVSDTELNFVLPTHTGMAYYSVSVRTGDEHSALPPAQFAVVLPPSITAMVPATATTAPFTLTLTGAYFHEEQPPSFATWDGVAMPSVIEDNNTLTVQVTPGAAGAHSVQVWTGDMEATTPPQNFTIT